MHAGRLLPLRMIERTPIAICLPAFSSSSLNLRDVRIVVLIVAWKNYVS